jgi:AcrR family transcriptional regulator
LPAAAARSRARAPVTPPKRRRRTTEEIVDRIMEAAGDEFERNGYAGTTTAAIARKAGVAEWLIFNHFGTKARLFEDSIFKPLNKHFLEFQTAHPVDPGNTTALHQESRRYILELLGFVERHSKMLVSLLVARLYARDNVAGLGQFDGLQDYFARATAATAKRRGRNVDLDSELASRISFATLLASVMFKDWLFPEGFASKERIGEALSDFIMDGIDVEDRAPKRKGPRR